MGGGKATDRDLAKKLKKRELECSALWETLKDMHISSRQVFDARQMYDLLALRALDTKAKRKLKIWFINDLIILHTLNHTSLILGCGGKLWIIEFFLKCQ